MGKLENLENLRRSGSLKAEPPDRKECEGLMRSAVDRLTDAQTPSLSFSSRFDLAYNAAHAAALTALRLSGFRSEKRYLVFQCLAHTADVSKVHIRLFALCHERRNLAEYEGYMDGKTTHYWPRCLRAWPDWLSKSSDCWSPADLPQRRKAGRQSPVLCMGKSLHLPPDPLEYSRRNCDLKHCAFNGKA